MTIYQGRMIRVAFHTPKTHLYLSEWFTENTAWDILVKAINSGAEDITVELRDYVA